MKFLLIVVVVLIPAVLSETSREINTTQFLSCNCDLTRSSCDVYCCCDQDCTELQKQSFQCKDSEPSNIGQSDWTCRNNVMMQDKGIFLILCIERENNPYLGLFYHDHPVLKDLPSVNQALQHKTNRDEVFVTKLPKSPPPRAVSDKGYVYGQRLSIISEHSWIVELYIPYAVLSSKCDFLHPVEYLKDISSSCLINIKESCETSQMNLHSYILGHGSRKLLATPDEDDPLQDIVIDYYIATDPCCYGNNITCCTPDKLKPYYHAEAPILKGGICYNSVLVVQYSFLWSGNRIQSANITVVLGNVPASDEHFIQQRFFVDFLYTRNESVPSRESSFSTIGYMMRDPLIGLSPQSEITSEMNDNMTKTHMFSWGNNAAGACSLDEEPVRFGVNQLTGCVYRIVDWDHMDCRLLREEVFKMSSSVLQAPFLSRSRAFDPENRFRMIHRTPPSTNVSDDVDACADVPDHVHLEITYDEVYRTVAGPLYRIVAAVRSYSTSTWSVSGSAKTTSHPLFSSVNFRYISVREEKRRLRTKRSRLPWLRPWERTEESWRDLLYPFLVLDPDTAVRHLRRATDVVLLVAILAATAVAYAVFGQRHLRLSARRS